MTTTSTYDNVNRLTQQQFPDGSYNTFAYDPVGNPTLMQDSTGTTAWTYDPLDRVVTCINGDGKSVQYGYDNDNRRTRMIDPDSGTTTTSYDKVNRLATLLNPNNELTTWTYDTNSRTVKVVQANGVVASTLYDAADRVLNLRNILPDGSNVFSSFTFTYDNLNNRLSVVEVQFSSVSWTYDSTYQLLSEIRSGSTSYAATYTYDSTGNRLTRLDTVSGLTTYSYDAADQLTTAVSAAGTTTYSYDGAGNRTQRAAATGSTTTYAWDDQNRLIGMTDPTTGVSANTYNAVGQRMETENSGGTTKFVLDSQNLLIETDSGGTTQVRYTVGNAADGQFGDVVSERFPQASTPHSDFYTFDALGSTDSLISAAGATIADYIYSAFGTPLNSGSSDPNRHTFVGKFGYQDDFGAGVYYVAARWYESDTGRWLNQDPIWPRSGVNPYQYVGNNPVNAVDPSGLQDPSDYPSSSGDTIQVLGVCPLPPTSPLQDTDTSYQGDNPGGQPTVVLVQQAGPGLGSGGAAATTTGPGFYNDWSKWPLTPATQWSQIGPISPEAQPPMIVLPKLDQPQERYPDILPPLNPSGTTSGPGFGNIFDLTPNYSYLDKFGTLRPVPKPQMIIGDIQQWVQDIAGNLKLTIGKWEVWPAEQHKSGMYQFGVKITGTIDGHPVKVLILPGNFNQKPLEEGHIEGVFGGNDTGVPNILIFSIDTGQSPP